MSKLVERVVAKQLLEQIHVHSLDNPYQSAYKTGHSTEIALLSIKNEVHLSLSRDSDLYCLISQQHLIQLIIPPVFIVFRPGLVLVVLFLNGSPPT